MKKVRPGFYRAVDRMGSELHMSRNQAVGSVLIVGKEMFGRNWKGFSDDSEKVDMDTGVSINKINIFFMRKIFFKFL